jgi:hypothetical protein
LEKGLDNQDKPNSSDQHVLIRYLFTQFLLFAEIDPEHWQYNNRMQKDRERQRPLIQRCKKAGYHIRNG